MISIILTWLMWTIDIVLNVLLAMSVTVLIWLGYLFIYSCKEGFWK